MRYVAVMVAVALWVLGLAGCGKPQDQFIGQWILDQSATEQNLRDEAKRQLAKLQGGNQLPPGESAQVPRQVDDAEVEKGVLFFMGLIKHAEPAVTVNDGGSLVIKEGSRDRVGTWTLEKDRLRITMQNGDTGYLAINGGRMELRLDKSDLGEAAVAFMRVSK